MVLGGKRPYPKEDLPIHSRILSVFSAEKHSGASSPNPAKRRRKQNSEKGLAGLANDIDDLICVSKDAGAELLVLVQSSIRTRDRDVSQLSRYLFQHGHVDFMPPLCVIVALVNDSCLRLTDIDSVLLLRRATFELQNTEVCSCRGTHFGVSSLLQLVLATGRSNMKDKLVQSFLSVLFHDNPHSPSAPERIRRFQLARSLLQLIANDIAACQDDKDVFIDWVRRAALPTRGMVGNIDEPNLSAVSFPVQHSRCLVPLAFQSCSLLQILT